MKKILINTYKNNILFLFIVTINTYYIKRYITLFIQFENFKNGGLVKKFFVNPLVKCSDDDSSSSLLVHSNFL